MTNCCGSCGVAISSLPAFLQFFLASGKPTHGISRCSSPPILGSRSSSPSLLSCRQRDSDTSANERSNNGHLHACPQHVSHIGESSGHTSGFMTRVQLRVAMMVWAPMSPTLLGYRNWARNMSIGFLTLSKPGHSIESQVQESTATGSTAWQRIFFAIAQLFQRNDGILPSPSSGGISQLLCISQPLTGQEESLSRRYPAPPAHLGFASSHMVSNLFTSFQYGYFPSYPCEPISQAVVVRLSSPFHENFVVTQHTSAGVFHHRAPTKETSTRLISRGAFSNWFSKRKPTENSTKHTR